MNLATSIVFLALIVMGLALAAFLSTRRTARNLWLMASLIVALLASATYFIPVEDFSEPPLTRGLLLVTLLAASLSAFGHVLVIDMSPPSHGTRRSRVWLTVSGFWIVAIIFSGFFGNSVLVGTDNWFVDALGSPDASTIVATAGYLLLSAGILAFAFYVFYRARLPEIANRVLFWIFTAATLLSGVLLLGSGTSAVAALGLLLVLVAQAGAAYALSYHHIFDVRSGLVHAVRTLSFVGAASIITFGAIFIAIGGDLQDDIEGIAVAGLLAILAAATFVPVRHTIHLVLGRLTKQAGSDSAHVTRAYSDLMAHVTELDALVPSATSELNTLLSVKSSAILLLNETRDDAIGLLMMQPDSPLNGTTGHIAHQSPVYAQLARDRSPLLQIDLEFSPKYTDIAEEERAFFRRMGMSAFAPIHSDNTMIGVLAVGQKLNDAAFYPADLELLSTLAQQTGIALRNARLVEDLQHLNTNMRSLNTKLKSTNEQLHTMDNVKSDFVTIASHELRTPLAQVRGYTDILDALNEQGMLDKDQTNNLIANLRKATERMEELISAMLDVSQLDVDAMDLRFADASVEATMRMAIEPLTDAIKQRKLTLSARGMRGLPHIQADLQRLVQAFRNVIVNAIKFTPDGGRIDISGTLQEHSNGDDGSILITITDSGVGVDPANLEMIFKKFFRAYDPSLHSTGTYKFLGAGPGLGLTIARGVIEGHGGRIWAESPGHDMDAMPGATFFIQLPVSMPEDARKRVLTFEASSAAHDAISQPPSMRRETNLKRPKDDRLSQTSDG